jgi:hypothetical protein
MQISGSQQIVAIFEPAPVLVSIRIWFYRINATVEAIASLHLEAQLPIRITLWLLMYLSLDTAKKFARYLQCYSVTDANGCTSLETVF